MTKDELRITAQELILHPIAWKTTDNLDFPWEAEVLGHFCTIRLNNFPEEPLLTLFIDGEETVTLEDWPDVWQRTPRSKPEKTARKSKAVFIAHPISGDIEGNMNRVLAICAEVHRQGVIPIAPYLVSLRYLNDDVVEDRSLGIEANLICFHRRFVEEVWLYGNRISAGMKEEVLLALHLDIRIVPKTPETEQELALLLTEIISEAGAI